MDATKEILKEGGKFTLFLQLHYVIYLLYGNRNSVEWDWVYTILETLLLVHLLTNICFMIDFQKSYTFYVALNHSNKSTFIAYIMFSSS